jgi:hypothetical protein
MDTGGSLMGDAGGVLDAGARVMDATFNGGVGNGDNLFGGISGVGDLIAGTGKLMQTDENGNWDPNWGGAGDIVNGGIGLLDATGVTNMGPWGAAIGGTAQAATNGYEAYEAFSAMSGETDPKKRAELERQGWGSAGDATLGALHAGLGSWCPVAELYISAFEMAGDGLGSIAGAIGGDDAKFGAGDIVGGVLDAIIPEEEDSWSMQAGNAVSDAVGGGWLGTGLGALAAGATNVVEAPVNLVDSAAGGIVNTIGNMFDSDDGERDDYWGQAKDWVGDTASSAWDTVSDW